MLEYLTYGKLITEIKQKNVLEKLIIDSEYYVLPDLCQQAKNLFLKISIKNKIAKWQSTSSQNQGYWNWNIAVIQPDQNLYQIVSSNTLLVKLEGVYLILIRTALSYNQQSYIDLYINGTALTRSIGYSNDNQSHSHEINEVFTLKSGDKIQIFMNSNNNYNSTALCNQLSIIKIN